MVRFNDPRRGPLRDLGRHLCQSEPPAGAAAHFGAAAANRPLRRSTPAARLLARPRALGEHKGGRTPCGSASTSSSIIISRRRPTCCSRSRSRSCPTSSCSRICSPSTAPGRCARSPARTGSAGAPGSAPRGRSPPAIARRSTSTAAPRRSTACRDAAPRAAGRGRRLSVAEPLLRGGPVRGVRRAPLRRISTAAPRCCAMARLDPGRDGLCAGLQRHPDHRRRRLRRPPGRLPRLCPSDGELRPRRRRARPAGLGLCLAARAARFPCRGRGLAGRRLACRSTPPASRRPRAWPGSRRPRRHRHRLHDHLRRGRDATARASG